MRFPRKINYDCESSGMCKLGERQIYRAKCLIAIYRLALPLVGGLYQSASDTWLYLYYCKRLFKMGSDYWMGNAVL